MRKLIGLACAALVSSCMPGPPAYTQGAQCGPIDEGLQHLADRFGEGIVFKGNSDRGVQTIVTASIAGTYTIIIVMPDGNSCLVDNGDGAKVTPPSAPEKAS